MKIKVSLASKLALYVVITNLAFSETVYQFSSGYFSSKALNVIEFSISRPMTDNQNIYIYTGFPQYAGFGASRFIFMHNEVYVHINSSMGILSDKIPFLDKEIVDDGLFQFSVSGTKKLNKNFSYTIGLFAPIYFSLSAGKVELNQKNNFKDKYNFIPLVFELSYIIN